MRLIHELLVLHKLLVLKININSLIVHITRKTAKALLLTLKDFSFSYFFCFLEFLVLIFVANSFDQFVADRVAFEQVRELF